MKITYGDFIDFLKENNAYEFYMLNYYIDNNKQPGINNNFELFFEKMNDNEDSLLLLDNAFSWSETPQGHSYWSILYSKLEEYMEDYKRLSRLKKLNRLKLLG